MQRTIALSLLSLALLACDSGDDSISDAERTDLATEIEESTEDEDLRDDGVESFDSVEVKQTEVARIELASGEVSFRVDVDGPAAGQLTMIEKVLPDEDGMLNPVVGDRTVLQAFLELTDEDVPVPAALLAHEEDDHVLAMAAERETVEVINDPISARPSDLLATARVGWSAAFMCNEGTTSQQFLEEICSMDAHWNRRFCHNGTWYTVTDSSGSLKVDDARSRTLACGANGRVVHEYQVGSTWYGSKNEPLPSGGVWYFTTEGNIALRRRITHKRTASGFVRGHSAFIRYPW